MKHIDFYTDFVLNGRQSGGGGITPTGTKEITIEANGTSEHDVAQYAKASVTVNVPDTGITPTGTKTITTNGKHDVTNFATADVQVPIPEAPTGKKVIEVTKNGVSTHDVAAFAQAEVSVAVPIPPEPTGEKVVNITSNGTSTEDVKSFATAKINVNVPSTGIVPEGVKEITSNGTHDVAQYAQAKVNVPQGVTPTGTKEISVTQNGEVTEDVSAFKNVHIVTNVASAGVDSALVAFVDNSMLGAFENADIKNVGTYGMYGRTFQSCNLPNATSVGMDSFKECKNMVSVDLPKVTSFMSGAFAKCFKLETVNAPLLARLDGTNIFESCTALVKLVLPALKSVRTNALGGSKLYAPSSLKVLDMLGGKKGGIDTDLTYCTSFTTLVLRDTLGVTGTGSNFALGASHKVYVPDALLEQYRTATNWSKYASQIFPLSEYVEEV